MRQLRMLAGILAAFGVIAFAVMLPAALQGKLHTEDAAAIEPMQGALISAGVGTLMIGGSVVVSFAARRASTPPGPWYVGLEKHLFVVTPRTTLCIPWGAFETAAWDGHSVVLRGRPGLKLGDSFTQNGRQSFEIVDALDAEGLARTCAVLIAGAPPVTTLDSIQDALGIPGANVPR